MAKREAGQQELIFGVHSLIEILKAKKRKVEMIYTTKPTPKAWEQVVKLLPKHVLVNYVSRDSLTRMTDTADHQGLIAYVQPFVFRKQFFSPAKEPFILMLDSIHDVRNVGAILRSAYCTGVNGVILISKHAAPLSGAAFKASAGLAEHLPIFMSPSAGAAMTLITQARYTPYLAVLNGTDATRVVYQRPLCLVIGNEAVGISKELLTKGIAITLPQKATDISYNASVAAGILMFLIAQAGENK